MSGTPLGSRIRTSISSTGVKIYGVFESLGSKLPRRKSKSGYIDGEESEDASPHKEPKDDFIIDNHGKMHEFYHMDKKKIGQGAFGSVSQCTNKTTDEVCALKAMSKLRMSHKNSYKLEIAVMKMMTHPNIVKLYETFEDHRNIYLVMELCSGGELFDKIISMGHFTEVQASIVMRQILRGILYMHAVQLTHRDMKPENLMFKTDDPPETNTVKIIDFGTTCKFLDHDDSNHVSSLTSKVGTAYYMSPQVLAGKYGHATDLWSCGVIMYVLLCGRPPFFGENDNEIMKKVRRGQYSFSATYWASVSEDAKDLIRMLIKMDPVERFTAEQAMKHRWIEGRAPNALAQQLGQCSIVNNLKGFRSANKLKKAALGVIAEKMGETQINELRAVFLELDEDGDGSLTAPELRDGLNKAGVDIGLDLDALVESIDTDGTGSIDIKEFLAAAINERSNVQEDACWAAFRVFDKDGDGKISMQELEQVLSSGNVEEAMGAEAIKELMLEVDENNDGEIDFDEFMTMMRKSDM